MRFQRSHLLKPSSLFVLIMLFIGAVIGKWFGEKYLVLEEERSMNVFMQALVTNANRISESVQQIFAEVDASPLEPCTPADQLHLRQLIFSGYQIKDIGRLVDGRLICSTLLGKISDRSQRSKAAVETKNGTYIYHRRALDTPGTYGVVVGRGNVNVVLSAAAFDPLYNSKYSFAIFITNLNKTQLARVYSSPEDFDLNPDFNKRNMGATVSDKYLYELRCDDKTGICISLQSRIDYTSAIARFEMLLSIIFGMLAFGCIAMGWLYYRSSRHTLTSRLAKALTNQELNIVYQPLVSLADGKVTGFEALLRWQITRDDFVPPDVFIPKAESAGLIGKITLYVLDRVIEEMGQVLRENRDLQVSININASDLQSQEFLTSLEDRLAIADIEPRQFGLEITERTAVDYDKSQSVIDDLRARGHIIYIDDFGTGYSSLACLDVLKVDVIKIDKSFTRAVVLGSDTVSIVPQIISMVRQHGLAIVIEGIETQAQVDYFIGLNVPMTGQGWYFGKPVAADLAEKSVGKTFALTKSGKLSPHSRLSH